MVLILLFLLLAAFGGAITVVGAMMSMKGQALAMRTLGYVAIVLGVAIAAFWLFFLWWLLYRSN
jgi:hypothetical protein